MALCPAYSGPICSLCCTLEGSLPRRLQGRQPHQLSSQAVPRRGSLPNASRRGREHARRAVRRLMVLINLAIALLLAFIYHQYGDVSVADRGA